MTHGRVEGTSSDPRLPRTYTMTIAAQDPSVTRSDGSVLLAQVAVPAAVLEAGPRGPRFHVVDYDPTTRAVVEAVDVESSSGALGRWTFRDRLTSGDEIPHVAPDMIRADYAFHAQNVYAIAARTLSIFEFALGRRVAWAFRDHQLFLVPHGLAEPNAYYSEEDHAILFGSFKATDDTLVHTCLSHDIVVHETTHAILDGLRTRFDEPALPDQDAFHEGFADVVALLSVFSTDGVVEHLLGEPDADGTIAADVVSQQRLRANPLFALAEEMGSAISGERGSALRRSVADPPPADWRTRPEYDEPHRRGEVIAAALVETAVQLWLTRLEPLKRNGRIDLARTAEEGRKAAQHLLTMAIRALDYSPPVELEFEDYLAAIVWSDSVVAPDDKHGYRESVMQGFARLGIVMNPDLVVDLARREGMVVYQNLNFAELQHSNDEVFSFVWNNADWLQIDRRFRLYVDTVKPAVRVGPDGLIVAEVIADYVQTVAGPAGELARLLQFELPAGLDAGTKVQMWGGGTVIFDQFGRAKLQVSKPVADSRRQAARLEYLARKGLRDTRDRIGFSLGTPLGQRFAAMHASDVYAGEQW